MFRVVVNPLLSRAVGCIRHQIPVRSLSRSFRRKDRKRNRENADNDEFRRGSTGLVWERRIGGTVSTIFVREIGLKGGMKLLLLQVPEAFTATLQEMLPVVTLSD